MFLFGNRQEAEPECHRETEIKLILLGEAGVGKTSLALRFASNEFRPYAEATIGVSFSEPTLIYEEEETKQKTKVCFKIWDTAGQEKYHALAAMYYRGSAAAVVVFDLSRPSSFQKTKKWIDELKAKGPAGIVIVLCGNKLDLESSGDRQVSSETGEEYAKGVGAIYIETSAKDGTNVKKMFKEVAQKVPFTPTKNPSNTQANAPIQLGAKSQPARRGCCR